MELERIQCLKFSNKFGNLAINKSGGYLEFIVNDESIFLELEEVDEVQKVIIEFSGVPNDFA